MILFREIRVRELLFLIKEIGYNSFCTSGWEAARELNFEGKDNDREGHERREEF